MRLFTLFMTLSIVFGVTKANSQISVNPWEIHEGTEGVLKHNNSIHGDPNAYKLAKIPAVKDGGWKLAPKDAKGDVSMKRSSVIRCREEIDFTYFQTIVNIPINTTVTDFKVSYDNADDGARIYFFNSKFPNGTFDEKSDLIGKHANFASTNLRDKVVAGENRIVIVQFDDCADNNSINGIRVTVNGKEIVVSPQPVSTPSAVANSQSNGAGITVFEHINYGGKSKFFGVGKHDITQTEFNDIISSVKIQKGYKVILFKDWKFTGPSVALTADTANLTSVSFNDFTSSIEVVADSQSVSTTESFSIGSSSSLNIARGKQCKSSSVSFGGVASRAVDGNTKGEYGNNSCTHTSDEKDPWWEIDLGEVYDVSSIKIWNRTDDCCWNRLQGFYVMASEQSIGSCSSAASFQYSGTNSYSFSSASQSFMTLNGNKRCRYIRIWIPGTIKTLNLAEVEVFGKLATASVPVTAIALPDKFKIHAYSISEGKGDKDDYWVAMNANSNKAVILSKAKLVGGSKWMEIESISLGNDVYAFKVLNAGADMYITVVDNKGVLVEKVSGGNIPDAAKFKSVKALTAAKGANEHNYRSFESVKFPNQYLRHESFIMYVHPSNNTELFKQDASWLIQKM